MKNIYPLLLSVCLVQFAHAQVSLPATLVFQNDDAANWSDGIATDGDGGSQNINDLNIQIFAADASYSLLPGSTMRWDNNSYYFSSDAAYNAITPGPDVQVTNNGVPAMVMRSDNPSVNFSLQSILLYDWGGNTPLVIDTYDDGVLVGSIETDIDVVTYFPKTLSQSDELTPAFFNDIDEIRFHPKAPSTAIFLSLNNISLAAPGATLPVTLEYFKGHYNDQAQQFELEWATSSEERNGYFDVENSANGTGFTSIGRVEAQHNGSAKNTYHFSYSALNDGTHYFRLRQVDIDGKSTLSPVIRFDAKRAIRVVATPNPTTGILRITSGAGAIRKITLFNSTGLRCRTIGKVGLQRYELDMSALPAGVYFLQVETNEGVEKRTVIKQ